LISKTSVQTRKNVANEVATISGLASVKLKNPSNAPRQFVLTFMSLATLLQKCMQCHKWPPKTRSTSFTFVIKFDIKCRMWSKKLGLHVSRVGPLRAVHGREPRGWLP
jgi:hypothetical protein